MPRRTALAAGLLLAACSASEDGGEDPRNETIPCAEPGARPGLRSDHDAVYVKSMDTIVVFGGDRASFDTSSFPPSVYTEDVWHYQVGCGAWSRIDTGGGPGRRGAYAAAVDEKRERVIVIGGRSGSEGNFRVRNDVWAYVPRSGTWKELEPAGVPPSRRDGHRVVHDGAKDRILLFGGNADESFGSAILSDTWELSFAASPEGAWRRLDVAGPTPARQDPAVAVDPSRGVALLFGGAHDFVNYSSEVWAFDLVTDEWRYVVTREDARPGVNDFERTPSPRFWSEMVASGDGIFFVFAGHDVGELGNRNDFWRLTLDPGNEGAQWQVVVAGDVSLQEPDRTSPERRDEHSLVWTPAGPWLFGGTTDCGPIDDMWTFGTAGWTPALPATVSETCVRRAEDGQFCAPLSCAAPL